MKHFLKTIDSISEWTGKTACWLAVAIIALISFEVIMRYIFNSPTMWGYETQLMTGAALYSLSWAYAQRYNSQIRIDVIYTRLSPRFKAGIDAFGTLFIFFPILLVLIYGAIWRTVAAWETGEVGKWFYWFPPLGPIRTVVAFGFLIFALQGVANFIRDAYFLVRNKSYD